MRNQPQYLPPTTPTILARQNDVDSLRLLIAQRKLYSRAKRWLALRWTGMLFIGVGAPVLALFWGSSALYVGAAASLWLFLGRTLLVLIQNSLTTKAATVQEQFDIFVFDMPDNKERSSMPSLEDIAKIVGPSDKIVETAKREKLLDWYPLDATDSGAVSVAVAQRANAYYADSLLRSTAIVWGVATALWVVIVSVVSLLSDVSATTFLLGVVIPLLPALLDVIQYDLGVWKSAGERRDLAKIIESHLSRVAGAVDGQNLLVWQERLFDLRRSAPEVPDMLYKIRRKINERAMHAAARQLSARAKDGRS